MNFPNESDFFFAVLLKIYIYKDYGKETVATLLVFPLYIKIFKKYKSIEGETIKDLS